MLRQLKRALILSDSSCARHQTGLLSAVSTSRCTLHNTQHAQSSLLTQAKPMTDSEAAK